MNRLKQTRTVWVPLTALLLTIVGCGEGVKPGGNFPQVIHSPDEQFVLVIDLNQSKSDLTKYLCLKFTIQDADENVLFQEQTGASTTMRWKMAWDEDSRVWLYSSDIGTYYWEQQAEGIWDRFTYVELDSPPHPPAAIAAELEK